MVDVRLTVVPNEMEAEMVCGLLETEGIRAWHRMADPVAPVMAGVTGMGGAREILVAEADLEAARALLASGDAGL